MTHLMIRSTNFEIVGDYVIRVVFEDKAEQTINIEFQPPTAASAFVVIERHEGNATTDFGAPAVAPASDMQPVGEAELQRFQTLLRAAWQAFAAARQAAGQELRKGPRGGERDLEKIRGHVLDADASYLRRLAWKFKKEAGGNSSEELGRTRQAVLDALAAAVRGEVPERGPRGGVIWPPCGLACPGSPVGDRGSP